MFNIKILVRSGVETRVGARPGERQVRLRLRQLFQFDESLDQLIPANCCLARNPTLELDSKRFLLS